MTLSLVGTWLLVSQHSELPDGSTTPSRGDNPRGILMYDANGYMSVQLVRTDAQARQFYDLRDFDAAMQGFHAYFGRYEVDETQQIVRHFVEGSGYFDYIGTTQVRYYHLDGDTLTLRAPSPIDGGTRLLVWRRVSGA